MTSQNMPAFAVWLAVRKLFIRARRYADLKDPEISCGPVLSRLERSGSSVGRAGIKKRLRTLSWAVSSAIAADIVDTARKIEADAKSIIPSSFLVEFANPFRR